MQITKIGKRYACLLSVCHAGTDFCNDYVQVDAQRRYLGGDSDHSILVKGLDFALFEQNKVRLASTSSKQDDEALEEVFAQTALPPSVPALKKRSRADIINKLKEKRANEGDLGQSNEEHTAENRVDASKFRPIGFKPIGASTGKAKKKKGKEDGESKKKKRKVESSAVDTGGQANPKGTHTARPAPVEHKPIQPELEEEDDFDIFAEAGEYKGMEYGSDDDSDEGSEKGHEGPPRPGSSVAQAEGVSAPPRRGWFSDDKGKEPEPEASPPSPPPTDQPPPVPEAGVEAEEEQLARLAPLNSSAMPSIREFLAMDEAVEKEEKRKARKEKRKGKNKGS
jgi:IK cytokine